MANRIGEICVYTGEEGYKLLLKENNELIARFRDQVIPLASEYEFPSSSSTGLINAIESDLQRRSVNLIDGKVYIASKPIQTNLTSDSISLLMEYQQSGDNPLPANQKFKFGIGALEALSELKFIPVLRLDALFSQSMSRTTAFARNEHLGNLLSNIKTGKVVLGDWGSMHVKGFLAALRNTHFLTLELKKYPSCDPLTIQTVITETRIVSLKIESGPGLLSLYEDALKANQKYRKPFFQLANGIGVMPIDKRLKLENIDYFVNEDGERAVDRAIAEGNGYLIGLMLDYGLIDIQQIENPQTNENCMQTLLEDQVWLDDVFGSQACLVDKVLKLSEIENPEHQEKVIEIFLRRMRAIWQGLSIEPTAEQFLELDIPKDQSSEPAAVQIAKDLPRDIKVKVIKGKFDFYDTKTSLQKRCRDLNCDVMEAAKSVAEELLTELRKSLSGDELEHATAHCDQRIGLNTLAYPYTFLHKSDYMFLSTGTALSSTIDIEKKKVVTACIGNIMIPDQANDPTKVASILCLMERNLASGDAQFDYAFLNSGLNVDEKDQAALERVAKKCVEWRLHEFGAACYLEIARRGNQDTKKANLEKAFHTHTSYETTHEFAKWHEENNEADKATVYYFQGYSIADSSQKINIAIKGLICGLRNDQINDYAYKFMKYLNDAIAEEPVDRDDCAQLLTLLWDKRRDLDIEDIQVFTLASLLIRRVESEHQLQYLPLLIEKAQKENAGKLLEISLRVPNVAELSGELKNQLFEKSLWQNSASFVISAFEILHNRDEHKDVFVDYFDREDIEIDERGLEDLEISLCTINLANRQNEVTPQFRARLCVMNAMERDSQQNSE